jgi:hypothetical protein
MKSRTPATKQAGCYMVATLRRFFTKKKRLKWPEALLETFQKFSW